MSLSYEDRKKKILEKLYREDSVKALVMAKELNVSTETIRRDLERLEQEGKLKKVYGGAVSAKSDSFEPPFEMKTHLNAVEKAAIGKYAASLINDGDTIMIGNGTTTIEIIRHLNQYENIKLVTHSTPTVLLAMEMFKGRIIFIGGEVNIEQKSATGPLAELVLSQLNVNKVFISAGGVSLVDGVTDYDLAEAYISRKMMERADEVFLLVDHTKFGKTMFANICPLHEVYTIITDSGCSEEWRQYISEKDIHLHIADEEESE
ncbi:DeoR family transcriptional regulator [Aquibacillus halophilus]|uniref:DeoR family transcriptional regulator n=1 Tax=Aquibacillus halophilus TaxID=930132 RepID=A0A6A8D5U9_9BACI|nr:DeoR/GlpR family DNA-binding transcription regulator [Aquibacillus halophilus]MRH41135.1 DeoR family transcriptional regulator [Aquibacillus halophilus]